VLGNYADARDNQRSVIAVSVAALVGLYLLLQGAFNSWRLAAAVCCALPVALSGALITSLAGGTISLGTLAGMLAVFALAMRHSVLYVGQAQFLRAGDTVGTSLHDAAEGGGEFDPALVLAAAKQRFAPVVTTVVAVALALLPVVFLGDAPGLEIVRPLAVTVLGGLMTSAFVALTVLPALFLVFGAGQRVHTRDAIVAD
jgi:Cu/Ag efflux pump CusA